MSDPFRTQIRLALANPNLQTALDNNAERRNTARTQVYASLPQDIQVMRQRAHQVRAEVIAHLDGYLEQFIANVQSNGIIVHRAADGAQAVQRVLEIAQQHNARLIAKSKTMVGEEIELNPALEANGFQVVETDLGEYIVQLRHEHPAHIVTPAVHLRREDVGQTFHEKLGVPYTDDVAEMTAVARRTLRQVFLQADVGISGVNFGVAENGILCLLTNEGNGRMVTTVPPVHIALMGIERLVPTLEDLALMLYLLPRSATGQKLTVYASLLRAPAADGDGPRERHLILVDNGRTKVRHSPLSEALYCIRCGACFNACPVFREIGGHAYVSRLGENTPYAGPIGSVLSPALFGGDEYGYLARASSLCGACREACPVDIDLPKLLLRVRAGKAAQISAQTRQEIPNAPGYLAWGLKVFTWVATSPARFYVAQVLAGAFSRLLAPFSTWMRLPAFSGWGYSKDFPRPSIRPFRARWNSTYACEASRTSLEDTSPATTQPGNFPQPGGEQAASPVERFAQELQALGGTFERCDASSLGQRVLNLLRANDITAIQAWQADHLPAGLLDFLRANGIRITDEPDPELKAGLTGALCAIAESGTLVLPGDSEQPLTASLLPEMHIAILRVEDICESLPQGLRCQEEQKAPATILISGPSRTADIEMTLTIGVHGPRWLHVFCIPS